VPVRTAVERFALADANEALARLQEGRITGAAVVLPPRRHPHHDDGRAAGGRSSAVKHRCGNGWRRTSTSV